MFKSKCLLVNRSANRVIILILVFILGAVIHKYDNYDDENARSKRNCEDALLQTHKYIVENYYQQRRNWKTSNVGAIVFKNVDPSVFRHASREDKTFIVLVWKFFGSMKSRHFDGGVVAKTPEKKEDVPLEGCSVQNCIFTGSNIYLHSADAILVPMYTGYAPKVRRGDRNVNQRWIFLSEESPLHIFRMCPTPTMKNFTDTFNWTMTYRTDADIPIPYGRTIPLPAPMYETSQYENDLIASLVPYWKEKRLHKLVMVVMSHCNIKYRNDYLDQLKKHIHVDVYGMCTRTTKRYGCPGHYSTDCPLFNKYLFYLAFENSRCRQYITEKTYHNSYSKGAIPVIMGAPIEDCQKLLPPDSYIHVDHYNTPKDLAYHILRISEDYSVLLSYHRWRNHFQVVNEHGFFGGKSKHYCRLCEALNYNDGEETLYREDDLRIFFDPNLTCKSNM